jgi:hypothetical protein
MAGIADFRLPIADIRNSKLETRNSEKTPLRPIGAEFRFSSFDFLLSQSAIGNQQSAMKTWSLGCGQGRRCPDLSLFSTFDQNLHHGAAAFHLLEA